MTTYSDLLKDPRWQRKRLEIFQRDNFRCRLCGDSDNTLHVHHLRYKRGGMPWEIDGRFLVTLCEDCHDFAHSPQSRFFTASNWVERYDAILATRRWHRNGDVT